MMFSYYNIHIGSGFQSSRYTGATVDSYLSFAVVALLYTLCSNLPILRLISTYNLFFFQEGIQM